MRTREEQEKIALDWLKYAIDQWFYHNYKSSLDAHTEYMLKQMDAACVDGNQFHIVWDYINRLRRIDRGKTGGLLKEPEILLRCAYAAARCKVYGEALKLCKEAYPKMTANKHCHGVALWMLGTLQWLYADQHDKALQHWERCKSEDFEIEKKRNFNEQGNWYEQRTNEMGIAILRGSLCNTIPSLYDIILPLDDKEQIQNIQDWFHHLRDIWSQYYDTDNKSEKLSEIIDSIPGKAAPQQDDKTYPAIRELIRLQEDRDEDYQSILHTMIEVALKIVEYHYYETARLLLIRVVRIHQEDHIYGLALWALGCIEWLMDKEWAKKNWVDSYTALRALPITVPGFSDKEMTEAIRYTDKNNCLPPVKEF